MNISQIQTNSLLDYPGTISSVVFLKGCNYQCGSCHARQVRDSDLGYDSDNRFLEYLREETWVDGVVILGGEPTIQPDLPEFLSKIKGLGKKIKLDTNGSNPQMLKKLLEERLVDYVAMDIKGPRLMYPVLTGRDNTSSLVEESMKLLYSGKVDYEFRTTVVPVYIENQVSWMHEGEIAEVSEWISKTAGKDSKYFLQKFVARGRDEMISERFSKEVLPVEYHETPKEVLDLLREEALKYLPNTAVR